MAIEKKSLVGKKAFAPVPTRKTSNLKAKVDTAKPAASKVISAMKLLP